MKTLAIDTETTGARILHGDRPYMISTCGVAGKIKLWEWDVDPKTRTPKPTSTQIDEICHCIEDSRLIFHHAKFDLLALQSLGVCVKAKGLDVTNIFSGHRKPLLKTRVVNVERIEDTLLASHVLDSSTSHNLKDLALLYLDFPDQDEADMKEEVKRLRAMAKNHKGWMLHESVGPQDGWLARALGIQDSKIARYAGKDAQRTYLLWVLFSEGLSAEELWNPYYRELRLMPAVMRTEAEGVTVRVKHTEKCVSRYQKEAAEHRDRCIEIARKYGFEDFNPNSGPQLQNLLFNHPKGFRLRPVAWTAPSHKFPQGQPSTDSASMTKLAEILSSRKGSKSKDALDFVIHKNAYQVRETTIGYVENYRRSALLTTLSSNYWLLHPGLNQTGTITTRFSSSEPNGQNISKGDEWEDDKGMHHDFSLRECFGPRSDEVWYSIDYSQLQLRIFAYLSGEQSIIDALLNGWDFHNFVASRLFKTDTPTKLQRRIAKNVNFCLIFGGGPSKVNATAGNPRAYDLFRSQFPNIDSYMRSNISYARKHGVAVTCGGYRIPVPPRKPYVATNYVVQGSEGDIVKNAMIDIDHFTNTNALAVSEGLRMILQVHDELLFRSRKSIYKDKKLESMLMSKIAHLMENSGKRFGMITPVKIDRHTIHWADGEVVEHTPLHVAGI